MGSGGMNKVPDDDKRGICKNCDHPIGYHHREDETCTVKDYRCPGYKPGLAAAT
jgi:hypothetical protein